MKGSIATTLIHQCADIDAKYSDLSMHLYVPYRNPYSRDFGIVYKDRKLPVWLWNGSHGVASATSTTSGTTEGALTSLTETASLPAYSKLLVVMTITTVGPTVWSTTFTFTSECPLSVSQVVLTGTRPIYATEQPRPITLDQAIAEAYAEPDPGDTFYDTLEFLDSVSGSKVLVVYSDEELVTPQGTFVPCKFGCKHPETEGGIVGTMQITIDFLPRSAQRWIMETCKARGKVTVYWRQYLGPNQEPDAHYPIPLNVTSVEQTALGATINASFPMLTVMKFPRRLMSTTELPGGLI